MTDERLSKIKETMAANRQRSKVGKAAKADAEEAKQKAAADAAAAWAGTQVMMQKVVSDINAELDPDDHKLQLKIDPPRPQRLGEGSVNFRSTQSVSDMCFTVWSETGHINIRIPADRDVKNETFPLMELTQEKWRGYLYDFMEARLAR